MIKTYLLKQTKYKSLKAQIRAVERKLLNRQRRTGVRTATLVRKIQQQMTAPATLLLAGGIGFILGELTWGDENTQFTQLKIKSVFVPFLTSE